MAEAKHALGLSIDAFIDWLGTVRQYSPHTLRNYRHDLDRLLAFTDSRGLDTPAAISSADIRQWATRLHREGLSGKSIQRALSAVRSLYRFLARGAA